MAARSRGTSFGVREIVDEPGRTSESGLRRPSFADNGPGDARLPDASVRNLFS
jgi:hypothetical protein